MPSSVQSEDKKCPLLCGALARWVEKRERQSHNITCPECHEFDITSIAIENIRAGKLSLTRLPLVRRAVREAVKPLLITEESILEIAADQEAKERAARNR